MTSYRNSTVGRTRFNSRNQVRDGSWRMAHLHPEGSSVAEQNKLALTAVHALRGGHGRRSLKQGKQGTVVGNREPHIEHFKSVVVGAYRVLLDAPNQGLGSKGV